MKKKKKVGRLFVVNNCQNCPNMFTGHTPGSGFGMDRFCKAGPTGKDKIVGYVEWASKDCQDYEFPSFCPLKKAT